MKEVPPNYCVWQRVYSNDLLKVGAGVYKTFSDDTMCNDCDGYDTKCWAYTPLERLETIVHKTNGRERTD